MTIKFAFCLGLMLAAAPVLAQETPAAEGEAKEEPKPYRGGGLGLTPGTLQTGNLVISRTVQTEADRYEGDQWEFTFHGYMRAPFRLGFGPGKDAGSKDTKLHVPPAVPDATYTDFRYTNNYGSPWAELQFNYGNDRAAAHVYMGAYNFTEAGYRDLQAQLGISQAFVTLNFPRAFGARGGLVWNVGGFMNSYGAAGRYDAGRYDTFLFGRTHISGETLTANIDLTDSLVLTLEHGIGAKLAAQPFFDPGFPLPSYLPYAGPSKHGPQATTLVHHAHVGVTYRGMLTVAGHYLTTWSDDAEGTFKDGRVTVAGGDVKLLGGVFGDGYIGFAHTRTHEVFRLAPALEFLHSYTGYNLVDNFFPGSDTGDGTIDSLLFQYTYSLSTLLRHPEAFWGQGPDVIFGVYGIISWVGSKEKTNDAGDPLKIPKSKSKFGADVTYSMLDWLAASFRYDLVQPDMKDNKESFQVLSPKLVFRTQFVTHEQVSLSYSHYFNGKGVSPGFPQEQLSPDENVVAVTGSMWW